MFDKKEYAKHYMRKWRKKHQVTEDEKKRRRDYMREWTLEKRRTDPAWVEKARALRREAARQYRKNPEWRKKHYKQHAKWVAKHRDHVNANQRRFAATPAYRQKALERTLLKKYGLTHDAYLAKIHANDGKCPICQGVISRGVIDHHHGTRQIRDVLCGSCNRWLGFIEKHRAVVPAMLAYLDKWAALSRSANGESSVGLSDRGHSSGQRSSRDDVGTWVTGRKRFHRGTLRAGARERRRRH